MAPGPVSASPTSKWLMRASVFVFCVLTTPQVLADSLRGMVSQALESNPEVRFEARALDTLKSEKRQQWGGYLPRVDVSASVGRARRDFDSRGNFDRHYAEVSVTQMLFDGFDVSGRVDEADQRVREQYYRLLGEAENKALEVTRAYLDVKRYRYLMGLAEQNVERHIEVTDQVRQLAEQGVSNEADLKQAEGRLALARSNLRTEYSNLQSVTARFQRLVGRAPAQNLEDAGALNETLPSSLELVLKRTFANNPEIHAAFANIRAAESSLTVAESEDYPTVELGLRHGTYKNNNGFDNRTDPDNFGDETLLELKLDYNLYRGGSDRAAKKAAWSRIGQAQSLRDKACVDLRQTATIAWSELLNLRGKLTLLESHQQSSSAVAEAYRRQFDIGRRSLLDVLDSENEAFQAERSLVHGQYDLQLTRADILHSMGQLLQVLSLSPETAVDADEYEQPPRADDLPIRYCSAASEALVHMN